jgi:hypothetical protein
MNEEQKLLKEMETKLERLLTATSAGSVGLSFSRDSAKLLLKYLKENNNVNL